MVSICQVMPGQPAPRWEILGYTQITGSQLQELPRLHGFEQETQMKDQLPAAHIAGIPFVVWGHPLDLSQGSRECVVVHIDLWQS